MITKSERKGNELFLTIKLADVPYRSKSAIAKAIKAGLKEDSVEPSMLATTGGFVRLTDCKVSLNVTK